MSGTPRNSCALEFTLNEDSSLEEDLGKQARRTLEDYIEKGARHVHDNEVRRTPRRVMHRIVAEVALKECDKVTEDRCAKTKGFI